MSTESEANHFDHGEQWEDELIYGLRSQRNKWAAVAIVCLLIALFSVLSLLALVPLKTISPIVIEVDKATGRAEIQTIYDGDVHSLSTQEILSRYFINKYLIARESYDKNLDLEENYTLVQELSSAESFAAYAKRFATGHVDNPFSVYGDNRVKVKISSIGFLRGDAAMVKYSLIEQKKQGGDVETYYNAIIHYKFVNVPSLESARLKNPLGFKVEEFRRDIEIVK